MIKKYAINFFLIVLSVTFASASWGQAIFSYTGSEQTYLVPPDVYSVQIEVTGAEGGNGGGDNSGIAGKGARITGTFDVVPGETLIILVGEQGEGAQYVGGGGGGTFVWKDVDAELMIAAGGGGGGGASDGSDEFVDGINASIDENATNGAGFSDGAGTAGNGGTIPTATNYASGGAGWLTAGNDGTVHGCEFNSTSATSILFGGFSGQGGGDDFGIGTAADGGFGGGSGGNARCGAVGGGGAGGYSGGGAGGEIILNAYNGGGGGGSFNAGNDPEAITGVGVGNGEAIITPVCKPIEIAYTTIVESFVGNGAIDITVTGGGGSYSFDWDTDEADDFDDSEDLIGLTAGTYTVVVRDESICDDVTQIIEVASVVGIEDASINVSAYPNPTSDFVVINLNGYFQYNVYGIDGAAITSGNGVNSTKIDLSNVSKGIYFFEVKNAAGTRSIKIIKE
tara:strand:- start:1086 stop:2444 length:1359 start_codon:yes stop_codon:yes gene_type:complete